VKLSFKRKINQKYKIYLVSKTPRRKEILADIGLKFKVRKNLNQPAVERIRSYLYLYDIVRATFDKLKGLNPGKKELLIACDTIVVYNGRVLGKPKNRAQARSFLKKLSGKKHKVISCLALVVNENGKVKRHWIIEKTTVYFSKIALPDLEKYIKTKEPYDKAGGYGIQDTAKIFIKKINGCYFNVVGLPIHKFLKLLKKI
jgi:septum formation protein